MKPRSLALLVGAAVLSPAAPAVAASHWSSPTTAIPISADAGSTAAPQAFITPGGRSLVLSGDGAHALLAAGDVTNAFGAPVPIGDAAAQTSLGVRGALGASGELAVIWAADRAAFTSVVPDGGQPAAATALPGGGVNALDVGVASDGSRIAAYRTKEGTSTYKLLVAVAPAGGAFGEPVVVDSGGPIDQLQVATGPGGAAAIAYRKNIGKRYWARVAVRPAGAAAFETPQSVSDTRETDDLAPHVAFDGDGTIVAAWAGVGGSGYALRPAGAAAFQAPQPLGSGATTDVDLTATPTGGTAVALSGGGRIQVAGQAAGGLFGPVTSIGSFGTDIGADAAVTADPAGTVTVIYSDPGNGEVHATDVGGADTVIGYGAKDTQTPVAVAARGDRTLAVWRSESGGISAATRSEQAPPNTGIGPAPAGADRTGPKITLPSKKLRRLLVTAKTKTIRFKVRVSEPATLLVTGDLRTKPAKRKVVSPLSPFRTKKAKAGTQTVTLKLGTKARKVLVQALRKRRGGQVFLVVQAFDAQSNASRAKLQLTLKPKPTHRR